MIAFSGNQGQRPRGPEIINISGMAIASCMPEMTGQKERGAKRRKAHPARIQGKQAAWRRDGQQWTMCQQKLTLSYFMENNPK
jgi:hypothetical protein